MLHDKTSCYEGEFVADMMEGLGILKQDSIEYIGNLKSDKF